MWTVPVELGRGLVYEISSMCTNNIDLQEVYLLQTRLQKMPYKHIAAHLKKTELACRLHYHQLSHGSNRRKRTTSMSSSSSSSHSPMMMASIPSPIHESSSRSVSPVGSLASYGQVQLPSIMGAGAPHHHHSNSPRLPAILPKPANMSSMSPYQQHQHNTPLLPSASFSAPAPRSAGTTMAPLRLDTQSQQTSHQPVDMGRLHAVYSNHRNAFWSAVAADYGNNVHPSVLEQAWRTNSSTPSSSTTAGSAITSSSSSSMVYSAPITPVGSPDERDMLYGKQNKTRISAILGIDANPRSPKERDMVRRIEEERAMVGVGA